MTTIRNPDSAQSMARYTEWPLLLLKPTRETDDRNKTHFSGCATTARSRNPTLRHVNYTVADESNLALHKRAIGLYESLRPVEASSANSSVNESAQQVYDLLEQLTLSKDAEFADTRCYFVTPEQARLIASKAESEGSAAGFSEGQYDHSFWQALREIDADGTFTMREKFLDPELFSTMMAVVEGKPPV